MINFYIQYKYTKVLSYLYLARKLQPQGELIVQGILLCLNFFKYLEIKFSRKEKECQWW
jgi:hypothetical protein